MNLYQHLLIIIPSVLLALWGFYAKETTVSILAAMVGFGVLIVYGLFQVVSMMHFLFFYLGTL